MNSLRSALTGWPAWWTETYIRAKPAHESVSSNKTLYNRGILMEEIL
jgi:hypothetical protein